MVSVERPGKQVSQGKQQVTGPNGNILPFVNNSASIEHISNIIDEKFSDINMSQYSINEDGLGSNMSCLFGQVQHLGKHGG